MSLREVRLQVVELPTLLGTVERPALHADPRHPAVEAGRQIAVVVDAPVAEDLEVLRPVRAGGVRVVERIRHRSAVEGRLRDSVHLGRGLHPGSLQDRGHHVGHVVELSAEPAGVSDPLRPRDGQPVAGAAQVRGHLLHPLEGCILRPGPSHVVMALAGGGPEVVHVLE